MSQSTLPKSASLNASSLSRLMRYHDRQFVELAYQVILGRDADEAGLAHHLDTLRSGESRQEVAYRIATSDEGRSKGVDPKVFDKYRRWLSVERIPVIGAIFLALLCLVRIRYFVREFRRLQNSAYGGLRAGSSQDRR